MNLLAERKQVGEELAVRRWRFEQFLAVGFSEMAALVLARSPEVDVDLVRRMRDAGCPPELALEIVL